MGEESGLHSAVVVARVYIEIETSDGAGGGAAELEIFSS